MTSDISDTGEFPLDGVRVVELSGGRGELCARLLSDLGAEVVLVEPPGGVWSRRRGPFLDGQSLYFAGRNAGKRSVVADLSSEAGRSRVLELLGSADILIDSLGAGVLESVGLDPVVLGECFPRLVIASVSDFGASGPYAGFRGSEAVLAAAGGVLDRSGLPGRAPVIPPGELATETSAVQAVWCVLLAYWNRLHLGLGDRLDVSLHDTTTQVFDPAATFIGVADIQQSAPKGRTFERYPILACADGHVRLVVLAPRQWHAVRSWIGDPEELMDPGLDQIAARYARWSEIQPRLETLFASMNVHDVLAQAQERGVPVERVSSPADVLRDEHFRARGAFAPLVVGGRTGALPSGFFEIDGVRVGARGGVPAVGGETGDRDVVEDVDPEPVEAEQGVGSRRPLTGLRVIDLGVIVAGAELGRLFASQGAEVIKVENAAFPDADRTSAFKGPMLPSSASRQRGKRSVGVNLRSEAGRAVLLDLVAQADLVFSNFKPGTLEKLGLGVDVLTAVNPRLVVVDSSALGVSGPRAKSMGYGPLVRAATSLTARWRDPDVEHGYCDAVTIFPDHFVARVCAVGALALLIRRQHTAAGGAVSISQAESILNVLPELFLAESLGDEVVADSSVDLLVECHGDDEWCAVTLFDDADWLRLGDHLGSAGVGPPGQDGLIERLRSWAATLPPVEVMTLLQGAGLAAGAVMRAADYPGDPQAVARGAMTELDQPGLDAAIPVESAPCLSARMPDPELRPAPRMFADTREVTRQLLGLTEEEIDEFIAAGVLEVNPHLEPGLAE